MPAGLTQKPLIPGEFGRVYWTLTGGVEGKWWGRVPRALKSRGIQQPAEGVKGGVCVGGWRSELSPSWLQTATDARPTDRVGGPQGSQLGLGP